MKNYRVRVRDEKTAFFEELMRYLDFCDYESVEGFAEPRIYPGFEFKEKEKKHKEGRQRPSVEGGWYFRYGKQYGQFA